jgi:transcriptional regulator with XRE-family HTH domain
LSAEALAERVSKLGWPISRTTVTKIELEQRGVYVEEAFIIAAALNVPPPVLFFGLESGEHVTLTEKSTIHPDLARKWLCGEGPLADTSRAAIGTEDWYGAAGEWESAHGSVRLYELLNEAQEAVHAAWRSRQQAEWHASQPRMDEAKDMLAKRLTELWKVLADMRRLGITPPQMPKEWREEAGALGLEEDE